MRIWDDQLRTVIQNNGPTSYRLEKLGFSRATYYSIRKGNSVSTNTINQLCTLLHCEVSDVMEFIEAEEITD